MPPRLAEEPVTHKQLTGWLFPAAVALVALLLTFGSLIVSKAEAAGEKVENRVDKRLERIETKVDKLLERGAP
jgi:hypothetical protein